MTGLKIALAKGRLADDTIALLQKAGMDVSGLMDSSRKLILHSGGMDFFLVKPTDVPVYVERGTADIGVCGKDTLMESGARLYEMLDMGFGKCKLCLCGYPGTDPHRPGVRVATKYTNITREYYRSLGETAELIHLSGSVEIGPMLGMSDVILDIVESGRTLRENGLVVLEELYDISARLCVNRVSLKLKADAVKRLTADLRRAKEETL